MPRAAQQQTFNLERFDSERSEFLNALRIAIERLLDCSKLGMSELHLKTLIITTANLCTYRDLDQSKMQVVDWTDADWSRELRCSRSTLFKLVAIAKASGFLDGSIGALVINKAGVRLWLCGELPTVAICAQIDKIKSPSPAAGLRSQSGSRTIQSGSRTIQSGSRTDTIYTYSHTTDPEPVQSESPADGLAVSESGSVAGTVLLGDQWPEYLSHQPEIDDALSRDVDPLAPGDCIRGAFTPLTDRDMACCKAMTLWFRRQLSLPDPVCGSTEAHLLTVIAIGLYAARMPVDQVRRNRVAVFVSTLKRQQLRRVLKYLPEARQSLDLLITETDGRCIRIPEVASEGPQGRATNELATATATLPRISLKSVPKPEFNRRLQ